MSSERQLKDIDTSQDVTKDIYDKWEYLLTHTLGRHFSQINITSKMTNIPVRTRLLKMNFLICILK